jgi:hypothetical protein
VVQHIVDIERKRRLKNEALLQVTPREQADEEMEMSELKRRLEILRSDHKQRANIQDIQSLTFD